MARYKRYFPVSHEINRDPEVWEMTDKYGDRSLRFILEIFSLIDRHENRLPITDKLMATLSRMLRQSLAKCWSILGEMLAKHWLIADEVLADGRPSIVSARNYADYHRTRSVISKNSETKSEQIGHPPTFPTLPTEEKKESSRGSQPNPDFATWWEITKKSPAYAGIDCDRELDKMKTWLMLPKNKHRKLTKQFALNWLNKIDPGQPVTPQPRKFTIKDAM